MFDSYEIKKDARGLTKANFPGVTLIPLLKIILPVVLAIFLFGRIGINLFNYYDENAVGIIDYLTKTHGLKFTAFIDIVLPLFNSFTLYWNNNYFLHIINNRDIQVSPIEVLKKSKFKVFLMYILKTMMANIIISLWTILLIIPGIVKSFSYLLVPYIAIDQPELGIFETLKESERLMYGQKLATFNLHLSFILWFISIPLTLCLSSLYVSPYMGLTDVVLYNDLKYEHKYTVSYEERIRKLQEQIIQQQNQNPANPQSNIKEDDDDLSIYGAHSLNDIESMDENKNQNETDIPDAIIKNDHSENENQE